MREGFLIPGQYNAAADLVDRNVAEGRGDQAAILCEGRRLTYRGVQVPVNRVGNAPRGSGVAWNGRSCSSGRTPRSSSPPSPGR